MGTALLADVSALALEAQQQVARFKKGHLDLEDACFWLKSLIGAFFASTDGLTFAIRSVLSANTQALGVAFSRKIQQDLDTVKRLPLERAVPVALRGLAAVFLVEPAIDTSTEDFRGFKALAAARERFAHPKSHLDICPFELFPTINPSLEWFYFAWRATLVNCLRSQGLSPAVDTTANRRFSFRDDGLAAFTVARDEQEAHRSPGFTADLGDVYFALTKDTGRAMDALLGRNTLMRIPPDVTIRNLIRTLFTEIEGVVLIAASLLHKHTGGEPPSASLLIGSHEDVRTRVVATLDQFSEAFGVAHRIPSTEPGWRAFASIRERRNRIGHPKSVSDLDIPSDTLDTLIQLLGWWHEHAAACLELDPSKLSP